MYFVERKEKFARMADQMNEDKSEQNHCQIYFSSLPVCQTSATDESPTIIYDSWSQAIIQNYVDVPIAQNILMLRQARVIQGTITVTTNSAYCL